MRKNVKFQVHCRLRLLDYMYTSASVAPCNRAHEKWGQPSFMASQFWGYMAPHLPVKRRWINPRLCLWHTFQRSRPKNCGGRGAENAGPENDGPMCKIWKCYFDGPSFSVSGRAYSVSQSRWSFVLPVALFYLAPATGIREIFHHGPASAKHKLCQKLAPFSWRQFLNCLISYNGYSL